VLGGTRHGTPIKVAGRRSAVSFLEIELYQAALRGKGIRIYVRNDFEPDMRLSPLLDVLSFVFGDWRSLPRLSDAEILSRLKRDIWLARAVRISDALSLRPAVRRLVQAMYVRRARSRPPPSIFFLNNEKESAKSGADLAIVSAVLDDMRTRDNEEQRLS